MAPVTRLPHGAERRARIVEAAISVIANEGVEALSHRRVAAAAGVPRSATTYYFESLEDLRWAAVEEIVRADLDAMNELFNAAPADSDLSELLGRFAWTWLKDRKVAMATLEIVSSGARRESIRELADTWTSAWIAALEPRVGPVRARTAIYAAFGWCQHALIQKRRPSLDEVITIMRQALSEAS
ncbi:MAG TPA: TetR family transcriptional regulator [Solirubrobacteraceae bacterium]|nr:TetR family transcriptional regulator [Solirubrobacteraceae bacterium]